MDDFETLYNKYARDLYQFSYWLCRDQHEAEDIVSETFLRAFTNFSSLRFETLKGYLFKIARNIYLESQRKRGREVEMNSAIIDTKHDPRQTVEFKEVVERLNMLLVQFAEVDRSAFILATSHELPYAEIARILDISLSAVKVKIHRIRLKLAETLLSERQGD